MHRLGISLALLHSVVSDYVASNGVENSCVPAKRRDFPKPHNVPLILCTEQCAHKIGILGPESTACLDQNTTLDPLGSGPRMIQDKYAVGFCHAAANMSITTS